MLEFKDKKPWIWNWCRTMRMLHLPPRLCGRCDRGGKMRKFYVRNWSRKLISLEGSGFSEDRGGESFLYSVLDGGEFVYGRMGVPENFMEKF